MRLARNIVGVAAVALLGLLATACTSTTTPTTTTITTLPPLPPQVYAYVTMIGTGASIGIGHSVVPVNVSLGGTGAGTALAVGTYPDAIAITPSGTRAYVTNYTSNSVTPIDLQTGKALPSIALGSVAGPAGIAIAPDGGTAYVTDAGASGTLGDTITPIDLLTDKTLPAITVGPGPEGIAITPDGARAYVADAGAFVPGQTGSIGSTVTPVDLTTNKALAAIPVGNAPAGIAITPNGCGQRELRQCHTDRHRHRHGRVPDIGRGRASGNHNSLHRAHDCLCRCRCLERVDDRERHAHRPHDRHRSHADRGREEPAVNRGQPRRLDALGRLLRQPDPRADKHQDAQSRSGDPPTRRAIRHRRHRSGPVRRSDQHYDDQGRQEEVLSPPPHRPKAHARPEA